MKSFKFLRKGEVKWKSFGGHYHPLRAISSSYISYVMLMLSTEFQYREELPPQDDGRTSQEWYEIFVKELKRRDASI